MPVPRPYSVPLPGAPLAPGAMPVPLPYSAPVPGAMLAPGAMLVLVLEPVAAVSAFYGAMAVALPAALFARAMRRAKDVASQSAAMMGFVIWELIKIALTVALLVAARWLIEGVHWLALLAGMVVALKMYWVALAVRPRLLNRI